MNKKERTLILCHILIVACVFSCSVTAVPTLQNEIDSEQSVSAGNKSISIDVEKKPDSSNKVISDNANLNGENENLSDNVEQTIGQAVFADAASQNAGTLNDITTGGTPVVVTLPETASLELQAKVEQLSASVVASHIDSEENRTKELEERLIDQNIAVNKTLDLNETKGEIELIQNKTSDVPEEIPSFSEWAQKRMEEAEKNEEVLNESTQHHAGSNGKSGSNVKLGWKNYASPDCGAKVVAANAEAVSSSSVISPSREEYKLNVCTNRVWFIVELCEAIQAKKIDIANFELFSSSPKDFVVSVGDRFPSREWTTVGQFTAKDERDIQSFDLNPYLFGRYIKVEIKSHYGSQHFCPISLFRVYGISELEVLQKEELQHNDEDDDEDSDESASMKSDDLTKNMLNSATNAVYSMFKKAAEVLGTKSNETEEKSDTTTSKIEYSPLINTCSTPSHRIVCFNCTDLLFGQIYELLSCESLHIQRLTNVPFLQKSLTNSDICTGFGIHLNTPKDHSTYSRSSLLVESFFPKKILGAMCNYFAVSQNQAVLNISQQFPNLTKNFNTSDENLANIETTKVGLKIEESAHIPIVESDVNIAATDELKFDSTNQIDSPKSTCSTDISHSSQIKPTKTVSLDVLIESSIIDNEEVTAHLTKSDTPINEIKSENEEIHTPDSKIDDSHQTVESQIEIPTESTENIEHIENFMTDINGENGPSTVPAISSNNNPADRQKESVFLRLSNRIKALERNVSLSSQYLEELSRRYKKQVEDMQKMMEKTLQAVTEERKKMDERNKQLEERLEHLMMTVGKWPSFIFWFFFTSASICALLWLCRGEHGRNRSPSENIERRKSIDIIRPTDKKPKVRRPSDQALKIVRSSLLSEERKISREKRKRKKSTKGMKRSNSATGLEIDDSRARGNGTSQYASSQCHQLSRYTNLNTAGLPTSTTDWVEENSRIFEIIPLDEPDNSSLEPFSTIMEQIPQYTKTAKDSRAHRISSQEHRPTVNGDHEFHVDKNISKKSSSFDESYRFKKIIRRSSLNSSLDESSRKKEKRSIKSVLKNVFT